MLSYIALKDSGQGKESDSIPLTLEYIAFLHRIISKECLKQAISSRPILRRNVGL